MEKKKIEFLDNKFSDNFNSIITSFINDLNEFEFTKDAKNEFVKRIKEAVVIEKAQPKKKLTLEDYLAIINAAEL